MSSAMQRKIPLKNLSSIVDQNNAATILLYSIEILNSSVSWAKWRIQYQKCSISYSTYIILCTHVVSHWWFILDARTLYGGSHQWHCIVLRRPVTVPTYFSVELEAVKAARCIEVCNGSVNLHKDVTPVDRLFSWEVVDVLRRSTVRLSPYVTFYLNVLTK